MIKVYRVQDSDGRGPFKPGVTEKWLRENQPDELEPFPVPKILSAMAGARFRHIGCGCTALSQLRIWFTHGEYAMLLNLGYRAVEMWADEILLSDENQVLFSRKKTFKTATNYLKLYEDLT